MKSISNTPDSKATAVPNTLEQGLINHELIISMIAPNTPTIPTLNAKPIVIKASAMIIINESLNIPAVVLGQTVRLRALTSGIVTSKKN